jgi:hypothetical protein
MTGTVVVHGGSILFHSYLFPLHYIHCIHWIHSIDRLFLWWLLLGRDDLQNRGGGSLKSDGFRKFVGFRIHFCRDDPEKKIENVQRSGVSIVVVFLVAF